MEYRKSVENPILVGAMTLAREDMTPEHQKLVSEEILKAKFILPAVVDPMPEEGAKEPAQGSKVIFPMIKASNGKNYFLAFTDITEYKQWNASDKTTYFAATIEDYGMILFRKNLNNELPNAEGFVINPFSHSVTVPKESVWNVISMKAKADKENTGKE